MIFKYPLLFALILGILAFIILRYKYGSKPTNIFFALLVGLLTFSISMYAYNKNTKPKIPDLGDDLLQNEWNMNTYESPYQIMTEMLPSEVVDFAMI